MSGYKLWGGNKNLGNSSEGINDAVDELIRNAVADKLEEVAREIMARSKLEANADAGLALLQTAGYIKAESSKIRANG